MPPDNPVRACFDAARALQLEAGDGISTLPVTNNPRTRTRTISIAFMNGMPWPAYIHTYIHTSHKDF